MDRINVTIISDASFNYRKKVGGYAFHIELGKEVYQIWGPFNDKLSNPLEAEMKCVLNALFYIRKKGVKIGRLKVITDSMFIAEHMFKKKQGRNRRTTDLVNRIKQYLGHIDYNRIEFEHVKAHTDNLESYNKYINDWCDKMSKEGCKSVK
jgi:ribonuclease HI